MRDPVRSDISYDLGPYRLLGIVRHDAQVVICTAVLRQNGEDRILKIVLPGGVPGGVIRRFLREARALASMQHAGVSATYESDRVPGGAAWVALQPTEGESLHQWLNRTGSLKRRPAVAAAIVAAVADACSGLARVGVVHGDLRPVNVRLVPEAGADGRFRARLVGSEEAALRSSRLARQEGGEASAAEPYRAPELWTPGARPDVRSEIHALGTLFFELLTGTLPFQDGCQRRSAPPDLTELVPGIAPEMQRSIERMLAREPSRRYQSMDEVITAVELMLGRHRSRFAELLTSEVPLLAPEPPSVSSDLTPLAPALASEASGDWLAGTLDTLRVIGAAARQTVVRRLVTIRQEGDADSERPTVLVAEDDDDTRQSVVELLEENGYRVVAARHGREAEEILRKESVRARCMLMDLWMPEVDGWTLAAEMQQGRLPKIPTIVMTAAEPHWGYPCPVVVRKPFDTRRLLDLVQTVASSGQPETTRRTPA